MAREILTLQFGHYSNYIGSHFWNIQELSFDYTGSVKPEFNHDVLYREGSTRSKQTTYTPRLLLSDLKGSLKSLLQSGQLEKQEPDDDALVSEVVKLEQPPVEKNEFLKDYDLNRKYDFANCVDTWTDYLYPRLHERTMNIVNTYSHNDEAGLFETFPQGVSTWKSDYGEEFSDRIRRYVEECDNMQGFHVNFDTADAFSGLAISCIEYVVDEYSKPLLVHPILTPHFPDNYPSNEDELSRSNIRDSVRLVNLALSLDGLIETANLFIPISTAESGWRKPGKKRDFTNVVYDSRMHYHTSSILASALDTLSLRYRYRNANYTISDMCADLSGYGRKMAGASLGLPFCMNDTEDLLDCLNNAETPLYTSITPNCVIASDKICQLITVRGIPEDRLKRPMKEAHKQFNLPAYRCESIKEMFQLYFQANCFLSLTDVSVAQSPLGVKTPYPNVFSDNLSKNGFMSTFENDETAESIPVIAGYHNGLFVSETLEKLVRDAKRLNIRKYPQFKSEGLEDSELKDCLNRIEDFKLNYEENHDL